jgi:hypothetical protein
LCLRLLRRLLPRRAGSRLPGQARRLLLPGQGLLDRQLSGWLGDPLLGDPLLGDPLLGDPLLGGAGRRPAQLGVLVADFALALHGQLGPAFGPGGRLFPLAPVLSVAPTALVLSAVAAPTA